MGAPVEYNLDAMMSDGLISVPRIQVFAWCVFFIVLLTMTLSYYVAIFNPYIVTEYTRTLPIPESKTIVGDVWPRLEVDFRSGNITFVFLHIQKTGGKEFAIHFQNLRRRGEYEPLCRMKRNITNYNARLASAMCLIGLPQSHEMWLVSETTYGWLCGVHPSLVEMRSCLPMLFEKRFGKRNRYFQFFTFIRHPIIRYISEFYHIRIYGIWPMPFITTCNYFQNETIASCISGINMNTTLKEFMSCPESWSNNRQTIMLADVDQMGCLDPSAKSSEKRDSILLETAKRNLKEMIYFGVTEYMKESVLLLEHRLDVEFDSPFSQPLIKDLSIADLLYKVWNNKTLYKEISSLNYLDMQLYEYGLKLFDQRLRQIHINIDFNKTDKLLYFYSLYTNL